MTDRTNAFRHGQFLRDLPASEEPKALLLGFYYAIFRFSYKPRVTISSVAKMVIQKVPSPETLDITGFSATSKPKVTTPTQWSQAA